MTRPDADEYRLSQPMMRVLENARVGRPLDAGAVTPAQRRGRGRTLAVLRRWGWIVREGSQLTAHGRAAVAALLARNERRASEQRSSAREHGQVLDVTPGGLQDQVVTSVGRVRCRPTPCPDCPWRKDAVGKFSPEAFRHSARTAYDMSTHVFSCHSVRPGSGTMCAGFLLRGADHNLSVRLKRMEGTVPTEGAQLHDGGHELHDNYRAMAVANGVDADDDALRPCRD